MYHKGFQSQVQQSSASADLALKTVPGIEKQIQEAQNTVQAAEEVIYLFLSEDIPEHRLINMQYCRH